jgi:uncharacterized protein YjiS (DUF1127 family)
MLDPLTKVSACVSVPSHPSRGLEKITRSMTAVMHWIELHRQREHLDELDAHQLADLGISRAQVRKECSKWPWQA